MARKKPVVSMKRSDFEALPQQRKLAIVMRCLAAVNPEQEGEEQAEEMLSKAIQKALDTEEKTQLALLSIERVGVMSAASIMWDMFVWLLDFEQRAAELLGDDEYERYIGNGHIKEA